MKKFLLVILMVSLIDIADGSQFIGNNNLQKDEKKSSANLNDFNGGGADAHKGSASKAKRRQEANDRKIKKEYRKYVSDNRKRALEIQTPEVRARMKQNRRDADNSADAKKKYIRKSTRNARKKYS